MATTPKMVRGERKMKQSLAFGRNLIVLAALVLTPGLWGTFKGAQTLRWPRAEATIIDAKLRTFERDTHDANYRSRWHSFAVHYRYNVGGTDYYAGGVEPYDFGMQNSAGAKKMQTRHPIGSKAPVAYDPNNASVAYLEPGPSSFALILVAIGVVIGASGLWIRSLARRGIGEMAT